MKYLTCCRMNSHELLEFWRRFTVRSRPKCPTLELCTEAIFEYITDVSLIFGIIEAAIASTRGYSSGWSSMPLRQRRDIESAIPLSTPLINSILKLNCPICSRVSKEVRPRKMPGSRGFFAVAFNAPEPIALLRGARVQSHQWGAGVAERR